MDVHLDAQAIAWRLTWQNEQVPRFAGRVPPPMHPVEVETAAAAAMIGVPVHTIRNWAARGYLQPLRTEGTKTIYSATAVAKVAASFGYLPELRTDGKDCCAPRCPRPAWEDTPIPLCQKHAMAIWLFVADQWGRLLEGGRDGNGWRAGEWDPAFDPAGNQQPLVYFVQMGDLIKIGTTTNLPARLSAFRGHSGQEPRVLLAVSGGQAEEAQVHALFRGERVRGEWFQPSERLLDFIEERRELDIRNVHGSLC